MESPSGEEHRHLENDGKPCFVGELAERRSNVRGYCKYGGHLSGRVARAATASQQQQPR
jgi:hypothetical protein